MSTVLTGRIVIAASVRRFTAGSVNVQLEDVSYADAAAPIVARTVIPGIAHDPGRGSEGTTIVGFSLTPSGPIDPEHDYAVRAWLDRDGDGQPGSGDVWSDQACRVLTRGFGTEVTITLDDPSKG